MNRNFKLFIAIILSTFYGCASQQYYVNDSIENIDISSGYRLGSDYVNLHPDNSESLLVLLAFSGGGTRAAAYSYGVLEALRDINITWEGQERRLLDEVDSISSVSGGSFTAAYFGLYGERVFEDFEQKFLKQDIQSHLRSNFISPWVWGRRSEFAAEYYDEILFEEKTFGDMKKQKGPLIQINATEVSTGTQFTFTQETFDLICSDLSTFPVSRAVTASSAVPVLFTSITINNYADRCKFKLKPQAIEALNDPDRTSRRRHLIEKYSKYLDNETYPYLHLFDGGLTDNLGIRPGINRLAIADNGWELAKLRKLENMKRIVFIVVNAQAEAQTQYSKVSKPVPLFDAITGATSIPLNEYTFESLVTLKVSLNTFSDQYIDGRCADRVQTGEDSTDCGDFKTYMVVVDIDSIRDKDKRIRLDQLPTTFVLKSEEVDELREAAKTVLHQSKEFQDFLADMN